MMTMMMAMMATHARLVRGRPRLHCVPMPCFVRPPACCVCGVRHASARVGAVSDSGQCRRPLPCCYRCCAMPEMPLRPHARSPLGIQIGPKPASLGFVLVHAYLLLAKAPSSPSVGVVRPDVPVPMHRYSPCGYKMQIQPGRHVQQAIENARTSCHNDMSLVCPEQARALTQQLGKWLRPMDLQTNTRAT